MSPVTRGTAIARAPNVRFPLTLPTAPDQPERAYAISNAVTMGHPLGDRAVEEFDDVLLCTTVMIIPMCYGVRREQSHQAATRVRSPQFA